MSLKEASALLPKITARLRQTCREALTHRALSLPPELKYIQKLDDSLTTITERWPDAHGFDDQDARPVFLLSAGWRSGSTLLQRLLCSSGELVMWGEPLGDSALIPRLAHSLTVLTREWPPDSYFAGDVSLEEFSKNWIANITPPISTLRHAHRALLDTWLAKPALDVYGESNWGLKEVRLTIEHARYLKWLYPNARFIFIYRNLFDAYLSWRGNAWASAWPGYFSWSPIAYARHWKLLLSGYLDGYQALDGMLIKYEDLIAGNIDLDELARHTGLDHIDSTVLKKKIGSPDDAKRTRRKKHITPIEKIMLSSVAGGLMQKVGYSN